MVRPTAISCGLSPEELGDRQAAWQALAGRVDVVERSRFAGGFRLAFRARDSDVEAISGLVAAERECCGWAEWDLEQDGERATLTVSGQEELIAPLAQAFLGSAA